MQFKDGKKEGSVEFDGIKNWSGKRATFRINLIKPVIASGVFDREDLHWDTKTNKAIGIKFNGASDIAKAYNHKDNICISMPPEIIEFIISKDDEVQDTIRQEKINQDFKFKVNDTDTYGIYNGISEFDIDALVSELKKQYDRFLYLFNDEIAKILSRDPELKQIAFDSYIPYPENENWNEETKRIYRANVERKRVSGYGIIPNSVIREKINKLLTAEYNKDLKEEQEREDNIKELLKKAKETGEKQLISKWTEDCNDPREECNTDICYYWAMPDGTTTETRNHTW